MASSNPNNCRKKLFNSTTKIFCEQIISLSFELADENGQVKSNEMVFARLMMVWFKEPKEYAL